MYRGSGAADAIIRIVRWCTLRFPLHKATALRQMQLPGRGKLRKRKINSSARARRLRSRTVKARHSQCTNFAMIIHFGWISSFIFDFAPTSGRVFNRRRLCFRKSHFLSILVVGLLSFGHSWATVLRLSRVCTDIMKIWKNSHFANFSQIFFHNFEICFCKKKRLFRLIEREQKIEKISYRLRKINTFV